jgi:hypothetical protein
MQTLLCAFPTKQCCRSTCAFRTTRRYSGGNNRSYCWMMLLPIYFPSSRPVFMSVGLEAEWCWLFINLTDIKSEYQRMRWARYVINSEMWGWCGSETTKKCRGRQNTARKKLKRLKVFKYLYYHDPLSIFIFSYIRLQGKNCDRLNKYTIYN